jgi:hypothetical protein
MANYGYFAPIRNIGETLVLGPLEPEACRALLKEPMESFGISYADDRLIDQIMDRTGRRPNLLNIISNQILREVGPSAIVDEKLVEWALSSGAVNDALEGWRSLSWDKRACQVDRIIVYAMLRNDSFFLSDVISAIKAHNFDATTEELRLSLQRLNLAFILKEERNRYAWRVPLFRDRRRLEEPEMQLADELVALA